VHAGRARHHRKIDSIVDHDERAIAIGRGDNLVTQLEEPIGGKSLRPQLDALRTAIQKGARQICRLPAGAMRDVDVDDGVERG
jgi:hypothetical protein